MVDISYIIIDLYGIINQQTKSTWEGSTLYLLNLIAVRSSFQSWIFQQDLYEAINASEAGVLGQFIEDPTAESTRWCPLDS